VRHLRDATIKGMLGKMFSVRSVPWYYKQNISKIYLVLRESPASKVVNTRKLRDLRRWKPLPGNDR
jgi:hypothetical protein